MTGTERMFYYKIEVSEMTLKEKISLLTEEEIDFIFDLLDLLQNLSTFQESELPEEIEIQFVR